MTVWVFKSRNIQAGDTMLALPFPGLPDLTGITSEHAMRKLLGTLNPDAPPETIVRQAEVHWRNVSQLAVGDLLVIPVKDTIGLAEVVKPYRYDVEAGEDMHRVEVKWLEVDIAPRKLSGLAKLLAGSGTLQPVEHAEQRKQVYALLKRSYNRFMRWRWILGIAFGAQAITMIIRMIKN